MPEPKQSTKRAEIGQDCELLLDLLLVFGTNQNNEQKKDPPLGEFIILGNKFMGG